MEENNFDKQVRAELEKFRLRPSAPVWEKIEDELREKKRRRVIFFIFILAGIMLVGYSGYTLLSKSTPVNSISQYEPGKNSPVKVQSDSTQLNDRLPINSDQTQSESSVKNTSREVSSNKDKENSLIVLTTGTKTSVAAKPIFQISEKPLANDNSVAVNSQPDPQANSSESGKIENKIAGASKEKSMPGDPSLVTAKVPNPEPANPTESIVPSINNIEKKSSVTIVSSKKVGVQELPIVKTNDSTFKNSSTIQGVSLSKTDTSNSSLVPTAIVKDNKKKKQANYSKKIQWLADISSGISGIYTRNSEPLNSPLSFGGVLAPSFSNNLTGNAAAYNPPSPIKPDLAFRLGVIGRKSISNKIAISSGLRYAYYSTRMKAGTVTYSAVAFDLTSSLTTYRNVYTGNEKTSYINRYHFLQVPINVEYKLTSNSSKLPVAWSVGGNFSYLIASRNLIYSEALGGIYYRDKDALNKTHVELNTGFQFTVSKKLGLSVGPDASIDLRRLIKEAYGKKQQLFYSGISARMSLFRK